MTATWTAPKTWNTGELVTASLLNTHLRDNLEFLKTPPTGIATLTSDFVTTSTSFTDVTGLSVSLTTVGGDVLVGLFVGCGLTTTNRIYFDLDIDGVTQGGTDGLYHLNGNSAVSAASFVYLKQNLSAALHTIKLRVKVSGGTLTLHGNQNASNLVKPQFWVREVS